MQNSQINRITVPQVGDQAPGTVWKAAEVPMRVVVDNNGPGSVLLAHDPGTLSNAPAFANTYLLAEGRQLVVVLAPKQGLYAVGLGIGGEISIAVSEALPIA